MATISRGCTWPFNPLDLRPHPRLIVAPQRLARLQRGSATHLTSRIRELADAMLEQPVVERVMDGRRLLTVARSVLDRCSILGLAHLLWGGPYAARVRDELAAVAAFSDWNPAHFLDTAEMAAAVAIGLDWCWDALTPDERAGAASAIVRHALGPVAQADGWWQTHHNNWNQVCYGGLVMAALTVAPEHPTVVEKWLSEARNGIEPGLRVYGPEGVYLEGPTYWEYGTTYSVLMADALKTAMNADWGVAHAAGFLASAGFAQACTAPSGLPFCYGDSWHRPLLLAPLPWMFSQLGDAESLAWAQAHLARFKSEARFLAFATLWSADVVEAQAIPSQAVHPQAVHPQAGARSHDNLTWVGHGLVEVASLRSAWTPDAWWIGLKAGHLQVSHGHLDAGSIELEAFGVRWFTDLGAEAEIYNRLDGWTTEQQAHRWNYLRTHNHGHNVLQIGHGAQQVAGHNPIKSGAGWAVANLSAAYADVADTVHRGVALFENGILIQDEIFGLREKAVHWQIFTQAEITCHGDSATLRHAGQSLTVRIVEPVGAIFSTASALPNSAIEDQNHLYRRLVVELRSAELQAAELPIQETTLRVRIFCGDGQLPPAQRLATW